MCGFGGREAEVAAANLNKLALRTQTHQRQRRIVPRDKHEAQRRGLQAQQFRQQLVHFLCGDDLVVVEDEDK